MARLTGHRDGGTSPASGDAAMRKRCGRDPAEAAERQAAGACGSTALVEARRLGHHGGSRHGEAEPRRWVGR